MGETFFSGEGAFFQKKEDPFPRPHPQESRFGNGRRFLFFARGKILSGERIPPLALFPKKAAWVSCSGARRARRNGAAHPNKETPAPAAPFGRRTREKAAFFLREGRIPLSHSPPRKPHGFPVPAHGRCAGTEQRSRIKKRPRPPPPSGGGRGIKAAFFWKGVWGKPLLSPERRGFPQSSPSFPSVPRYFVPSIASVRQIKRTLPSTFSARPE